MRALRACLVLAATLLLNGAGHAACSEVWSGRSSTHEVTVSDGDCEYGKLMIGVNSRKPAKLPPGAAQASAPGMVAFDSQCQLAPDLVSSFACRADGSTVLAGATYRRVPGRERSVMIPAGLCTSASRDAASRVRRGCSGSSPTSAEACPGISRPLVERSHPLAALSGSTTDWSGCGSDSTAASLAIRKSMNALTANGTCRRLG